MALKTYHNFANSISYYAQFTFANDELKYYLQETDLPSITYGITANIKNGETIYTLGDSKDKSPLSLTFVIDENFDVYVTLLDIQEAYRTKFETIDNFEIYLQNNKNINILKFTFQDIFFTSITAPRLTTTGDETTIVVDVEMYYKNFNFKKVI